MDSIKTDYLEQTFEQLQSLHPGSVLNAWRKEGFDTFKKMGLPTLKNEEWKYTGISNLFTRNFSVSVSNDTVDETIIWKSAIPGTEDFNHLVFINGKYSEQYSQVESSDKIVICPLTSAANGEYRDDVQEHFGKSREFITDGIHALNTSFMDGSVFIKVKKGARDLKPVYFHHLFDTTENHLLASPRSLFVVEEDAGVQIIESYHTEGAMDSFSNEVMEIVAKENAHVEVYKIQNDGPNANHAGTTHIRQIGKCYVHTVTVSLDGGMIRNNTDIIMEKAGNEAHMYGLYFLKGHTHVDNHTLVDNTKPNCFSNELYKGIIDDYATGVFSGKIYVRPDAQKINAYQSNKNILLSDHGSINTKPQLEIFADDVKCSHGCTVGRLDEEALYYLRARGIHKELAKAMLLKAFAEEIVMQIKIDPVKNYVEGLISARLQMDEK